MTAGRRGRGPAAALLPLIALACLVAVACTSRGSEQPEACPSEAYRDDGQLHADGGSIRIEVASTPSERERGLSGRPCIPDDRGLLFTFEEPDFYSFWMKEMRFAIDIVWIDDHRRVSEVTAGVSPDTYPETFESREPVRYVLEVGAGRASALDLRPGTQLRFDY